jgi:hypothetical protein
MARNGSAYLLGMLSLAFLHGGAPRAAEEQTAAEATVPKKEYEKLKQEVQLLKEQMRMLMDERSKSAQRQTAPPGQQAAAPAKPPEAKPAGGERSTLTTTPPPSREATLKEGDREKEAEQARKDLDEFLRRQKVLFTSGELQIEYNTLYSQNTTEIIPVKSEFESVTTGPFIRYGLADDLELNLSVPFVFAERSEDPSFSRLVTNPPQRYVRRDDAGLGDVSGALRWAALHEEGFIPETTLSLNVKSDTGRIRNALGTGFWNIGANVTLVKTIDPVVFFGSLGYNAVLQRGDIDPGDQIPYSLGMGFSLNDRVSFSTFLNGTSVLRTKINGRGEIPGSAANINTLNFAVTVQLGRHLFLEPFVGFGLTNEATDFVAGINIPFRFEQKFPLPFIQ